MTDRDDIELRAWARRTFEGEPRPGSINDTIGDDLARAHAGLTRRRRWTAGASGVAVAAVAFAIAVAPGVLPSAGDSPEPAGSTDGQQPDRAEPPKQRKSAPGGDGYPGYEQRMLLLDVAEDHLDPQGKHLSNARNVQSGSGGVSGWEYIGTKLNWKVPGEPGLGVVQVAIASPGMNDRDLRSEAGCGGLYSCEPRELPDGSTAWVGQSDDGRLGAAYRQPDGESVWVIVDPLFGNNSTTPVSSVDVTVDQLLAFVSDDRLRVIESDMEMDWDERMERREQTWDRSLVR